MKNTEKEKYMIQRWWEVFEDKKLHELTYLEYYVDYN